MTIFLKNRFLAAVLLSTFALVSCKSSDNTITIEDAPIGSGRTDTTVQKSTNDQFQQLAMGEVMPIRSLDPLFVENAAGMRAIQLLYEALVRYDENGEIVPAVAKDWAVSGDNLTYRFNLKSDIFYHDSGIFSNGLGRKLTARDVKYVFERMAKADVPDQTAQLFMNIRGFEPYYREQHQVLQAADRQLETISGIQVPNDSTITFSLVESDSNFVNKLAAPHAVIYPKEAVTSNGFKAVGSGPFKLSQRRSDSLYIFSRFENYRIQNQPVLNRVDIRTSSDEAELLQAMSRGDIQLIPQLGPNQISTVLNSNGELKDDLSNEYKLTKAGGSTMYALRYNAGSDTHQSHVDNALNTVEKDSIFANMPTNIVRLNWSVPVPKGFTPSDTLSSSYSNDAFVQYFYSSLTKQLARENITFEMKSTRVLNRDVEIFFRQILPLYDGYEADNTSTEPLVQFFVESLALSRNHVDTIKLNALPWWIDLRETTVALNKNR